MIRLLTVVVYNMVELYYQYYNMSTNIVQNTENVINSKNVYTSAKKTHLGLFFGGAVCQNVCCLGRVWTQEAFKAS